MIRIYERSVDAGHGRQYVAIEGGICVEQWLEAKQGLYTGDGNPDWVGKTARKIGMQKNNFEYIPPGRNPGWDIYESYYRRGE